MEIPIDHDPDFGSILGDVTSDKWIKVGIANVHDEPESREKKMSDFKEKLKERKIVLRPGDDHQLLGILRSADCEVDRAVDIVEAFLEYQIYAGDGIPYKSLYRAFSINI